MKTTKLLIIIVLFFMSQSCKKEVINNTTIKEDYNPPVSKIYGKWKIINADPSDLSETYMIFESNKPFAYQMSKDKYGFKEIQSTAYSVTEKTLIFGGIYVYEISNDTLVLKYEPNSDVAKLVRTTSTEVDPLNWVSSVSTLQTSKSLPNMSSSDDGSFAFDGDKLFFSSNYTGSFRFYKYNSTSNSLIDSFPTGDRYSSFYKKSTNQIYMANNSFSSAKPLKINDFSPGSASALTTSSHNYIKNFSFNPNSGVMYAFQSTNKLFSGTEGGALSVLFDVATTGHSFDQMSYYSNDEFLILEDNKIHKVKIAPSLTVTKSYDRIPNFSIYSISTNGSETWVFGYNNTISKYEFRKINL